MRKFPSYTKGQTPWLSDKFKEKELSRLTIDELLGICTYKKRIKHPFKKALIKYILEIEE